MVRHRSFIQRMLCQTIVKRDFEVDLFAFNQASNSILAASTLVNAVAVLSNWIVTIGAYHSMTV